MLEANEVHKNRAHHITRPFPMEINTTSKNNKLHKVKDQPPKWSNKKAFQMHNITDVHHVRIEWSTPVEQANIQ